MSTIKPTCAELMGRAYASLVCAAGILKAEQYEAFEEELARIMRDVHHFAKTLGCASLKPQPEHTSDQNAPSNYPSRLDDTNLDVLRKSQDPRKSRKLRDWFKLGQAALSPAGTGQPTGEPEELAREIDAAYRKSHGFQLDVAAIAALLRSRMAERPKIVCLCGSTRFYPKFQEANYLETMKGNIVLSVGFYPHAPGEVHHSENVGCTPEQKIALDELHKRKIDLADEVYVLNVGGYIGDSTRSEIAYAVAHRKPVRYLEALPSAPDTEKP